MKLPDKHNGEFPDPENNGGANKKLPVLISGMKLVTKAGSRATTVISEYAPQLIRSETGTSVPAACGILLVAAFVIGFLIWAAFAPLLSAAIAPGTVTASSNRKPIQHLEGGIIAKVAVKNGDNVQSGELLAKMDDTRAITSLEVVRIQHRAVTAHRDRLRAEREGRDRIEFSEWLMSAANDPQIQKIMDGQIHIFTTRRSSLLNSIAMLGQRVKQYRAEINGLEAQIKAHNLQLGLIGEEIKDLSGLVERGLARKPKLLTLQREAAEIEGRRGENLSSIAQAQQNIIESELRIIELRNAYDGEAASELRDVETQLFDLEERIDVAQDIYDRTSVSAPYSGTVVNLAFHSPGQVVKPGQILMDLVPTDDELIVEARVRPEDIDIVYPGLSAEIRLTALKQRNAPIIKGKLITISADSVENERSGEFYYLARIRLDDAQEDVFKEVKLYPGMQSEVMILTGESTMLEYILNPLTATLRRSLREESN
ncbi:MAG: HlyD family type I secretion periplasmic adaptor subunit [Pseudomonadota bacterium]